MFALIVFKDSYCVQPTVFERIQNGWKRALGLALVGLFTNLPSTCARSENQKKEKRIVRETRVEMQRLSKQVYIWRSFLSGF